MARTLRRKPAGSPSESSRGCSINKDGVIDFEVSTGSVHAQIEFLKPTTINNRAYSYAYEPGDQEPPPTATFASHRVVIRNARTEPGAADLQRHRVLQLNLWRPIRGPLRDFPLAICDASSIGPHQLDAVDLLYPGRRGEIYYLSYDPGQRWYYAPDMQVHEAWLIKNYDSAVHGTARFAAHSAFNEPSRGVRVDPRESIEVRAFAFFDI